METAILAPALFLLIFVTVQAALYFHARNVALGAAQAGVAAYRGEGGQTSNVTAAQAVRDYVDRVGGLEGANLTASPPGADTLRVTVIGSAPSIIPGMSLRVSQTAAATRERFVAYAHPSSADLARAGPR